MTMRSLLFFGLLAATPALAAQLWSGDFESGDLSQWGSQMVSPDRLAIVQDPVRQGKFALKATVVQGDNPIHASGNRNELFNPTPQKEGSESYYRWSTMFPEDYPIEHTWQVFTQWHQPDCCGSPPVQFVVTGEEIQFTVSPSETLLWRTPLVRGPWHDFILHVKFSNDSKVGFVELWYDGSQVVPKTYAETRADTYVKQGLYRNDSISKVGVVYHDGMVQGETLADVMPADDALAFNSKSPAGVTSAPGSSGPNSLPLSAQGGCAQGGNALSMLALVAVALFLLRLRQTRIPVPARSRRKDTRFPDAGRRGRKRSAAFRL